MIGAKREREKGREGKGRRRGGDRKPPPLKPKAKPHLLVGRRGRGGCITNIGVWGLLILV